MGEQQNIPIKLIPNEGHVLVHHDWGHKMDATLGEVSPKGSYAMLRFGLAGERKVKLTQTPSNKPPPGRFYGPEMALWFIDTATVEQLIATAKAAAEEDDG